MRVIFIALLTALCLGAISQPVSTLVETAGYSKSPAYAEIIKWWQQLDARSAKVKMQSMGMTDAGFPLHLVLISNDGKTEVSAINRNTKRIILFNNGIHPGEPDGIDASMLLARDIVENKFRLPDNIVIAIIPVYNIGGCLDRSKDYRVDQNGPEEFGFRGNSQNLDLNRDFIKCDSKDARAFAGIFHLLDPDVFVDNHVSDGADYQHVMTLLSTQHNKLGGIMGDFLNDEFEPALYSSMKQKGLDMVPYVNSFGDTPENGWPEYWDGPRYSSGYAVLWHCFSFVPETHMLKSYEKRVKATYELEKSFIEFTSANASKIKDLRDRTKLAARTSTEFPISWQLDRSKFKEVTYMGYEAGKKTSEVSGLPRLYYDHSKPFEKKVKIYNYFAVKNTIKKPKAYIIPQGWWKVTDLLALNKVNMRRLSQDTSIIVEVYHIDEYKSSPRPYEMHHPNSEVKVSVTTRTLQFRKGDWYIPMDQEANRFLIETLEPTGEDSYFAWNYFDGILGQKEGYSGYAFEDIAADYLKKEPALQEKLAARKATDTAFAKNAGAQLNFIYQNSPWVEQAYLRYPVYRVL
ncbi:MAG: M14 family metallopeptidase [Chitinophagaceae bacterium]|nr:M14 family metallopeptidase [Chitinophagaceae bacterium]